SAVGEIARLAELCRPQIGVITRIGEAHLGGFGSQRELARAKGELLTALTPDRIAVLNGDDPWLRQLANQTSARIVWVGRGADCHLTAVDVRSADGSLRFQVNGERYCVPVWGRHHLTSALVAIAVGLEFGLSSGEIAEALAGFE